MKLVNIPIGELTEHPRNYRRHSDRQLSELQTSLREYGWQRNVVVSKDRYILAGHGIVEAARRNGETQIPCEVQNHLHTAPEAEKFLALENTVSRLAEDDETALSALLADVQRTVGLDGTGYNDAELDALIAGVAAQNEPEPTEDPGAQVDHAAELQERWGTERGQVWQVGRHRLMCGDSTNAEDVGRLLAGATPRLMVTDPPYGVEYDPNWRNEAADKGLIAHAARRVGNVANDDRADWSPMFVLWPCVVAYTWCSSWDLAVTGEVLRGAGYVLRNLVIWAKPRFAISRGDYHWQHEPCWYAVKKGQPSKWMGDRSQTTLWQITLDENVEGGHSTQKPLECMERPIRNHEGDVADPFLGSGTTMVAAERLGRVCYGMELEPKYIAVSLERMAGMGLEPVLTGD